MKLLLTLAAAALLTANPAAAQENAHAGQIAPCATQPVERALALMEQRLKLAQDVARYKWNTQGKIEDLTREQTIIAGLGQQALKQGLPAAWAERFFRAQIEASKMVRRQLFAHWRQTNAGHFGNAPDLATVTRPKLDALTMQLISALAGAWPQLRNPACNSGIELLVEQKLKMPDYDAVTVATASAPLIQAHKP